MAPAVPNQKRKRGRPPAVPVADGDASERATRNSKPNEESEIARQDKDDGDVEEDTRPKKRGRPRKSDANIADAEADPEPEAASEVRRSKRDRRSIDDNPYWLSGSKGVQEQQEEADESAAPPKKRSRMSPGPATVEPKAKGSRAKKTEKEPVQETAASQAGISQSPRRRKAAKAPVEEPQEEETQPRRRGRPRVSIQEPEEAAASPRSRPKKTTEAPAEEPTAEEQIQPRRRGRPSLSNRMEQQEPEEAPEEPLQPSRRRKASKAPTDGPVEEHAEEPEGRGRPRLSNASASGQQSSQKKARVKPPPSKRRSTAAVVGKSKDAIPPQQSKPKTASRQSVADRSITELDEEVSASLPPVPKYRHIEPRTRQVPRSTISAKWVPLDEPSINTISTILSDTTRPVLMRLRDREQRYQQGHKILQIFSSRLRSKLRKGMPFPPPTTKPAGRKSEGVSHADELNFESTVDSIEALERTLNPLLDSIKLLEKEKAKEEAALKEDYKNLTALETNARAETRGWKERGRRAHALVPGKDEAEADEATRLKLARPRNDTVSDGVFHDIKDDEVATMSQQIANHMESMRGNLQPIQDILPAMGKSKAALQSVLQKHLAQQHFERVLLG